MSLQDHTAKGKCRKSLLNETIVILKKIINELSKHNFRGAGMLKADINLTQTKA